MTVGMTYFFTLFLASVTGYEYITTLLAIAAGAFLASLLIPLLRKTLWIPALLLTVAAALFSYTACYRLQVLPISALDGEKAEVTATVVSLPEYRYGRYYYVCKTQSIAHSEMPQECKIRISSSVEWDVEPYDLVKLPVNFYLSGERIDSSSAKYYASRGIYINGYTYFEPEITKTGNRPLNYYFLKIREYLTNAIDNALNTRTAGVCKALLLGDKSGLRESDQNYFRRSGVSHLFAVSGLHLAVLSNALFRLLHKVRMKRKPAAILTAFSVLLFMGITGFSPSVSRAGIMAIIMYLGMAFSKNADSLNSLGISALLLTILNPFAVQNTALLLSFFATLGILLLYGPLTGRILERLKKISLKPVAAILKGMVSITGTTIAATVFTVPILAYSYESLSLVGILANLLLLYPAGIALICTGLGAILGGAGFLQFLSYPLFFVAGQLARFMLRCAEVVAGIPLSNIYIEPAYLKFGLLLLAAMVILYYLVKHRLTAPGVALLIVSSMAAAICFQTAGNYNLTKIRVLDVGNATCVLVTRNGSGMLIGCGQEYDTQDRLKTHLEHSGVEQLELLLLPSLQKTESEGLEDVLKEISVQKVVAPPGFALAGGDGIAVTTNDREHLEIWEDVSLDIRFDSHNALVAIQIGTVKVLLSCLPESDASQLETQYGGFDVVICREKPCSLQQVPKFFCLTTDQLVNGVYTTKQQGDILIKTDGESYQTVRG